ncbi:MAG TPA: monovalent cation:proton antiporter-2 (CPA2) family protein [Flavitalea sp.]|nr:monovalent cation:proton antiporter-2 (CPA2) family protein [Flavitalea sp.]
MGNNFLLTAVVYLAAAVFCVPVAKKLGMGSVLGYLLAGIIIGPFVFGFVGEEGEDIMHFAEFGVVMMLFLVGLELEPKKLWRMRRIIAGVGTAQVLLTAAIVFLCLLTIDLSWQSAVAISLAIAMSSTAIVLQSLKEKSLLDQPVGRYSFAVLLFQDISVIPILALLPLLAITPSSIAEDHSTWLEAQPGWLKTVSVFLAVGALIAAGNFLVVPVLRMVAKTKLRELFTASSLLLVVSIAYLMEQVGLSPALGTFLAGVVLANSEFKHALESDLEPFKGLLLGLFFLAVGASINFNLLAAQPIAIIEAVFGIIVIKALVVFIIGRWYKLSLNDNLLFALVLSQIGEFAFILFSFIFQLKILDQQTTDFLMAVTALSMTITPILLLVYEKIILPRLEVVTVAASPADSITETHNVILAGFSHYGSTIGRFLRANGVNATILDNNPDQVDLLRKMGFRVYYGDATRLDLLESAGIETADVFISAIDSPEINLQLSKTLRKHYPSLPLLIRAKNRMDAYELIDAGVDHVYRESLESSVRVGVDVLRKLGVRGYTAYRAGQNFIRFDEEALPALARHRHNKKQYIKDVKEQIELQEELLNNDLVSAPNSNDHVWDSQYMRETINKQ